MKNTRNLKALVAITVLTAFVVPINAAHERDEISVTKELYTQVFKEILHHCVSKRASNPDQQICQELFIAIRNCYSIHAHAFHPALMNKCLEAAAEKQIEAWIAEQKKQN